MSRYDVIDRIFGDTEEEHVDDDELAFAASTEDDEEGTDDDDDEEDEEEEDEEEEDDDEPPPEGDAMLARLDKEFRKLRARVRASTDPSELRSLRNEHTASLAERLSPTVRMRTLDIIEAIDERVTDLRARRGRSD